MLEGLICPSDGLMDAQNWNVPDPRAKSNYAASMGYQLMPSWGGTPWGGPCTLYPGNGFGTGIAGHGNDTRPQQISGVYSRVGFASRVADISDGSSNTIAFGEVLPACGDHHWNGWWHWNSQFTATTAPINYPIVCIGQPGWSSGTPPLINGVPATGCNHWRNWQTSQGFKSQHEGGAFFLFADGRVDFLSENIDYLTYQKLGDRRDNMNVGAY